MTKVGRNDEEVLRIFEIGSQEFTVLTLSRLCEGANQDWHNLDMIQVILKDLVHIRQMHLNTVLVLISLLGHSFESACLFERLVDYQERERERRRIYHALVL